MPSLSHLLTASCILAALPVAAGNPVAITNNSGRPITLRSSQEENYVFIGKTLTSGNYTVTWKEESKDGNGIAKSEKLGPMDAFSEVIPDGTSATVELTSTDSFSVVNLELGMYEDNHLFTIGMLHITGEYVLRGAKYVTSLASASNFFPRL